MSQIRRWRVDCIVGARPNFVKIAPILRAIEARGTMSPRLVHTGQHYDVSMSQAFFDELAIPAPDVNLEVGSGTGTEQTARIMMGLERCFAERRPDLVIVVGDVNSTLATALVCAKLLIPMAHVEAGLRSGDRTMPEEVNRLVTDRLADLLLTTEQSAAANLHAEGIGDDRITFVGNVMIDSLFGCLPRAVEASATVAEAMPEPGLAARLGEGFGFTTLHRPSNVDDPAQLGRLLTALATISRKLPLIFAVHPRTRAAISGGGHDKLMAGSAILVTPPLSYLRTIGLLRRARLVITDSGGIQEETTALGVPCLTVRENTERPITVAEGTNTLVGMSPGALIEAVEQVLATGGKRGRVPELWDGRAAERIAERVDVFLAGRFHAAA